MANTNLPTIKERIPPHNLEAEQSFLGSLLIDPDAVIKVIDKVKSNDFYREAHRKIFDSIINLYERHEPIDILSLGNRLEELNHISIIGGRAYLAELSNAVPSAANVVHYAEITKKKAMLRRLISAASDITKLGYDESEDVDKVLDQAEQRLFNVSQQHTKQTFAPIRGVLSEAFERIDELHKDRGKLRGIPTGFTGLDNLLAGLQKSDLVVLAARPSVGKTSLALDIARNVGVRAKVPVGIFSLEMSKEQLVDRFICAEANIDLWRLRTGRLSDRDEDFPKIGRALGTLSDAPIFIDDSAACNIMDIRTKARRLQSEHGLGLLIIDYLQLMESRSNQENRVQAISEITRALKGIARELDVPVLVLSQLNRAVEMSKPAIPKLAHLRDSGSIEQDADIVMFIYRKSTDRNYQLDELSPEEKCIAEILVEKHRNGPTGNIKLYWDAERASFKNLERKPMSPPPEAMKVPIVPPPPQVINPNGNSGPAIVTVPAASAPIEGNKAPENPF